MPAAACPAFDRNGDEAVTVDELTRAIGDAVTRCARLPARG